MRLHSFRIQNFKSIIDTGECKISDTDNIIILAGQNESGKSSVLQALDFFANGPSDKFHSHERRPDNSETIVTCTYILVEKEKEYIAEQFSEYLEIKDFFNTIDKIPITKECVNNTDPDFKLEPNFLNEILNLEENTEDIENIILPKLDTIIEKLLSNTRISIYNSFNDLLPSEITISQLNKSNAVQDFEKVFGVSLQNLANISDARMKRKKREELESTVTEKFNSIWSQQFGEIYKQNTSKYKFKIEFNKDQASNNQKINFLIQGEDEFPLYLDQRSAGFQWFSSFHLRLYALMKDYNENTELSNITILIDEPGQNLHDTAQKDVKKLLNHVAQQGIQIIYSTHNPYLISDNDTNDIEYNRIRIVTNHPNEGSKVLTIPQFNGQKQYGNIDSCSPICRAMGLQNITNIVDFKKNNILVEGITDHYYLTAFRNLVHPDKNIFFIPLNGVSNMKSMIGLLIGWGENFKAISDGDAEGKKMYNKLKTVYFLNDDDLTKKSIYKLKENSIEDIFSQSDFITQNSLDTTDISPEKTNSQIIKECNLKKELIAREFFEKVKEHPQEISLDSETKNKINEIFEWILS